jgi:deferrochelatase/peroxidase EfeB
MVNRSIKDLVKESKKAVNSSYGSYTQKRRYTFKIDTIISIRIKHELFPFL